MNQIEKTQEEFFIALSGIQERTVCEYLNKPITKDNMESVLYDLTTEIICGVMTLLDGYERKTLQLNIIDKKSGESLRKGIELHDKCVDYLK